MAQVKPGMNQDEVAKILGTPSFQGLFKENVWYYYGVKESTVAFLSPRIDETRLIKISFDPTQHVSGIETPQSGIEQSIATSNEKTMDLSHKNTLFRRIFGNVGRFNKASDPMKSSRVNKGG